MSDPTGAVFTPVVPEGFELTGDGVEPPKAVSDRFVTLAKTYVVENYNQHHDVPLALEDVYILWFAKVVSNWKALIASPQARGMVWMVTNNGPRQEVYIEIYKKINNIRIDTKSRRKP